MTFFSSRIEGREGRKSVGDTMLCTYISDTYTAVFTCANRTPPPPAHTRGTSEGRGWVTAALTRGGLSRITLAIIRWSRRFDTG